jgi:protein subunit release factor B
MTQLTIYIPNQTEEGLWAANQLRSMYENWAKAASLIYTLTIVEKEKFILNFNVEYEALEGENGVHRLVNISEFDPEHRRHTSFVQVEVKNEEVIRSYILEPYKLCKDHRSNSQWPNVAEILNGDRPFIDHMLYDYTIYKRES